MNKTIKEMQHEIIQEMSRLNDWIDKYEYIIQLGKQHPAIDNTLRTQENAIPGCQSNVWIIPQKDGDRMSFLADSDSAIIRGMLVLLLRIFNHQTSEAIRHANLFFLKETGLVNQLSPSRANGLMAIIKQFRSFD